MGGSEDSDPAMEGSLCLKSPGTDPNPSEGKPKKSHKTSYDPNLTEGKPEKSHGASHEPNPIEGKAEKSLETSHDPNPIEGGSKKSHGTTSHDPIPSEGKPLKSHETSHDPNLIEGKPEKSLGASHEPNPTEGKQKKSLETSHDPNPIEGKPKKSHGTTSHDPSPSEGKPLKSHKASYDPDPYEGKPKKSFEASHDPNLIEGKPEKGHGASHEQNPIERKPKKSNGTASHDPSPSEGKPIQSHKTSYDPNPIEGKPKISHEVSHDPNSFEGLKKSLETTHDSNLIEGKPEKSYGTSHLPNPIDGKPKKSLETSYNPNPSEEKPEKSHGTDHNPNPIKGKPKKNLETSYDSKPIEGKLKKSHGNSDDPNPIEGKSKENSESVEGKEDYGGNTISRGSSSGESHSSSFRSTVNKPHKANDALWEAIQGVWSQDGMIGMSNFRILKRLGCGDIGSVYLVELKGTNSRFALKAMDRGTLVSRKKLLRAQTEREILQSLDHPFLPTLYAHFETRKFSCLVMEFCSGGDLHALRQHQPGKHFSEQAARFYAVEVLLGLEYLHMLGIIYRDLKPENVLVRDDGHIMLSDFDLSLRSCLVSPTLVKSSSCGTDPSRRIPTYCIQPACITPSCIQPTCTFVPRGIFSRSSKKKKIKQPKNEMGNQVTPLPELVAEPTGARSLSFVGTHEYLAPEIIKGEGHGSAVDWWTFGIFLYELLHGKTPFKGDGNRATLVNVIRQPLKFPDSPLVSFGARDLIRGLLVKDPQHRLASRRGATEIKQHAFFDGINWALIRSMPPPEVPKPFELKEISRVEKKKGEGGYVSAASSSSCMEFELF